MFQPRRLCFEDRTRRRTFAMYRVIVTVLLCLSAANTAPQDSSVTFVKIQPLTSDETSQNTTRESRVENTPPITSIIENNEFISIARNDDVTTEFEEATTEVAEVTNEDIPTTVQTTTTTRAPKPKITQSPRFLSKLSHYKKSNSLNTVSTNAINSFAVSSKVDKPYKRKFKSRCRCEKIENCPKLQITVPRCPNEYFLCCF